MRALWDTFDTLPSDQFYMSLAALLLALGLIERAYRMRGVA